MTKLEGALKRELSIDGTPYVIRIDPEGLTIVPKGKRTLDAHRLIFHGRQICVARKPRCEVCPVLPLCPQVGVS